MADQRPTNAQQTNTSAQGEEAAGDQLTMHAMQMEMLKALKEAREGQGMMASMMSEMQKQQEEMRSFRQQLMQVPTFQAVFPGSSQGTQTGANNNKDNQNVQPTATTSQSIPIIHLEPQNSEDIPPPRMEASQPQQALISTTLPPISQVQIPPMPSHTQRPNQQSQHMQTLHDGSVHQPISIPHTPVMHQYTPTPPRIHTSSQYVTKEDMIDVINQLRKQTNRPSELDFTPPYPAHIRRQPYPQGYVEHPPQFPKYNGEKGNAREHIARFVESMSPWLNDDEGSNHNILLREFNKTLTDSAFSWYYNLEKGSVRDWDDMKLQFFKKFFYVQKQVTIVELMRFKQKASEELS